MAVAKVYYADAKMIHLNLKCRISRILPYLNATCGCREEILLDLVDTQGKIIHLPDHRQDEACKYLQNNAKYILCAILKDDDGNKKYKVLLTEPQELFPGFLLETDRQASTSSHTESQASGRRSTSQASSTTSMGGAGWSKLRRRSKTITGASSPAPTAKVKGKAKASAAGGK
ncbi:uncharacterized protein LOC135828835 [Sycon ciliatum]|uniref:uncharacterized protein LOC135828835 n=1 Tax=Sycon ciliatum TaxID=27933 RepID=UPI0031F63135